MKTGLFTRVILFVLILTICFSKLSYATTQDIEKDKKLALETSYIVKPGDNLWKISKRFGVSINEMIKLNNISNPNIIYPGQVLIFSKNVKAGIMISFDDHSIDQWYSVRDLLKKNHAKVTFFVDNFDGLDKNSISKLQDLKKDGHEIACHSHHHLNAIKYIKEDSIEEYIQEEIIPAIKEMKTKGFQPVSFAYPYGARSEFLDSVLLKYFKVIRGTAYVDKDHDIKALDKVYIGNNYKRIVYAVSIDNISGKEVTTILEGLKRAKKNNEIIAFYGHAISTDEHTAYNTNLDTLEAIISYACHEGLRFYTCSEI